MAKFYFNGWHDDRVNIIPDGAVEITDEEYNRLRDLERNGNIIQPDENGYPVAIEPPKPETKTVRTFSKFSIWVATRNLPVADGSDVMVWDAFEKFLHDQNLWAGWNQLVDLVEDNPFFEEFYPLAVDAFGKELVDQVLAASVTSSQTVIVEVTPKEPKTPENGTETGDNTEPDAEQGDDAEPPAETPENGKEPESEPEQTE